MSFTPASQALARFKVLDLTRVRAGPTAARQLADWGANVIKIELPNDESDMGGPRHGPDFQNLHRNKRSLTLNLKEADGARDLQEDGRDRRRRDRELPPRREIPPRHRLRECSRDQQAHRLWLDFRLRRGRALSRAPGFDQIAQGMGGLMSITGLPGQGPVRVGIPVADLGAGIFCAMGILVALLEREVSGEGQWVQSSLLGAQISLLDFQAARWLIARDVPGQAGNDHPTSIPTGVFPTSDGHINIAAAGKHIYKRFCETLGLTHLIDDPRFAQDSARSKNRAAINQIISEVTKKQSSAELIAKLNKAGVPCGPINRMDEVFADPQVKHLGMAAPVHHATLGDIAVVNQPIKLSRTPSRIAHPTPEKGEHTEEILKECGYDDKAIAGFRARKIV